MHSNREESLKDLLEIFFPPGQFIRRLKAFTKIENFFSRVPLVLTTPGATTRRYAAGVGTSAQASQFDFSIHGCLKRLFINFWTKCHILLHKKLETQCI